MENSEMELNGRGRDGNEEVREKKEGNGKKKKVNRKKCIEGEETGSSGMK